MYTWICVSVCEFFQWYWSYTMYTRLVLCSLLICNALSIGFMAYACSSIQPQADGLIICVLVN